jgi:hypothetical protein
LEYSGALVLLLYLSAGDVWFVVFLHVDLTTKNEPLQNNDAISSPASRRQQ